jgi:hypothetical protein
MMTVGEMPGPYDSKYILRYGHEDSRQLQMFPLSGIDVASSGRFESSVCYEFLIKTPVTNTVLIRPSVA